MIRLIRISDGEHANAGTEIEAEMLEVQGYRRVDTRPSFVEQEQPQAPQGPAVQPEQPEPEPVAEQPADEQVVAESEQPARRRRP